jgi:hypothetical protein
MRTARTLELNGSKFCGEAWVRGKRKLSQVLGVFELLDFTMLRPVLAWRAFWNLCTVCLFDFPFFSGRGKPRILNQWIRGHDCIRNLYTLKLLLNSVLRITAFSPVRIHGCPTSINCWFYNLNVPASIATRYWRNAEPSHKTQEADRHFVLHGSWGGRAKRIDLLLCFLVKDSSS